ncbi:MAG: hypothetical protein QX189_16475 [Methylococcales bacterium]
MYYKLWLVPLIDEDEIPFSYYEFNACQEEDLEWAWHDGIKFSVVPEQSLKLKIDLDDPDAGEFADYIYGYIPLVSERFKSVLDVCGISNIDYYPVDIIGADKFEDIPKYYAFNVVGKIAAADRDKSDYFEAFGQMGATQFSRFVINESVVKNIDFFRLAEQSSTIIVSERIKLACEEAGIDTLYFIPLEETDND